MLSLLDGKKVYVFSALAAASSVMTTVLSAKSFSWLTLFSALLPVFLGALSASFRHTLAKMVDTAKPFVAAGEKAIDAADTGK